MLKALWLWSMLAVVFQWTWATAFSPLIETPRLPLPTFILVAGLVLVTVHRWVSMWREYKRNRARRYSRAGIVPVGITL